MNTIEAKNFNTRTELENHVRNTIGLSVEPRADFVISGTSEQLSKLQLSTKSVFWGIKCEIK